MLPIIQGQQQLTMSSREIAEYTEKQHSHVFRDIKKMLIDLDEEWQEYIQIWTHPQNKQSYEEFVLNRDLTDCLLTGYSAKARIKVIKRWRELEQERQAEQKPALTIEQQALVIAEQLIETTRQRDEAIATKAQINDKRTATIMGKLGHASKKIKKLEDQLQDVGNYLSLTGAKIPQRVDTPLKDNVQSWRLLKQLSVDMQLEPKRVKDQRYGEVLAYHIDVIQKFKDKYL